MMLAQRASSFCSSVMMALSFFQDASTALSSFRSVVAELAACRVRHPLGAVEDHALDGGAVLVAADSAGHHLLPQRRYGFFGGLGAGHPAAR